MNLASAISSAFAMHSSTPPEIHQGSDLTCSPSGELADELLEVGEQAKGAEGEETCSFCELIVELN